MSGDKSVVMEFNSDSDDDDNILRDLMSHHRPRQNLTNGSMGGSREGGGRKRKDVLSPTRKSMKQSGSDHGSLFSESDEDFCVIDAPTITKVVSMSTCTYVIFVALSSLHRKYMATSITHLSCIKKSVSTDYMIYICLLKDDVYVDTVSEGSPTR